MRLQGMAGRRRTQNEPLDAWLLMQLSNLRLSSPDPAGEDEEQEPVFEEEEEEHDDGQDRDQPSERRPQDPWDEDWWNKR